MKLKWANNYLNLELDWEIHNRQKSYDYTRNRKVEKLWYKVIRYTNSYMKEKYVKSRKCDLASVWLFRRAASWDFIEDRKINSVILQSIN